MKGEMHISENGIIVEQLSESISWFKRDTNSSNDILSDNAKIDKNKTASTKYYQLKNKKKVLLIEDEELSIIAQKLIFTRCGFLVDVSNSAGESLLAIKEKRYDIIFLDLGLPDRSGLDLIKDLRKIVNDTVLIFALTAHTTKEIEIQNYLNLGFNGFISKPLKEKDLKMVFEMIEGV